MARRVHTMMMSAAAAGLLCAVAGCGSQPTLATEHSGGTAVIALGVQQYPNWFFPVFPSTAFSALNIETDALMYKPLLDITPHGTIDYTRSIADKVTWNTSATVFTLHLNPKYTWSNGRPVTAKDVVFTWSLIREASRNETDLPWQYGGSPNGGVPSNFRSVTAVNPSTVRVTLKEPVNATWFLLNGLGQINPVPASVWDRYPHNPIRELSFIKSVANSPLKAVYSVVDGPYRLSSMTPNVDWTFVPNRRYGGKKSTLSKVVLQYETSSESEFAGLKKGSITVGYIPSSLLDARTQLSRDSIVSDYPWGLSYLTPNMHSNAPHHVNQLFDQTYIREALAMGVNQPAIIRSIYHGYGVEDHGPIPSKPTTPYYDSVLNQATYPNNPQAGKRLLEDHGWVLKNGVMTRRGITLSFPLNYSSGSGTLTDVVQDLAASWAREGIRVTLLPTSFTSLLAMPNNKWSIIYLGLSWVYSPDFYPTGGALLESGSPLNQAGYDNSEMNRLIAATHDPYRTTQQEIQRLDQYQVFTARQQPLIFLPYSSSVAAYSKNLHGYRSHLNPISGILTPNYWSIH